MHADAECPRQCRLLPAFQVKAPEGSILNASRPMAVNLSHPHGWYIAPNIFRALSEAAPDKVQATAACRLRPHLRPDADGGTYSDMLFMGGGQGASSHGDGKSGLLWPTRPPTPRSSCSRQGAGAGAGRLCHRFRRAGSHPAAWASGVALRQAGR